MGDRYYLTVKCKCGELEHNVYYAPTCGFLTWKCPKCGKVKDLEMYSGIDAESCANTEDGVMAIKGFRKMLRKNKKLLKELSK